jgi:TP53 regulating kinase-like protein
VVLDFSLGAKDASTEARGVDLHLLREALTSAHDRAEAYYRDVVACYREAFRADAAKVLAKVREIEGRGRYT